MVDFIKRSLFDFQKSLNEKFELIENENQLDLGIEQVQEDNLGITFPIFDKNFNCDIKCFIPLSALNHIVSNANYETFYLSQKWIKGFMHYRGESFSVIDPANFLSNSNIEKDVETRIVIFKSKDSLKYVFLVKDLTLSNSNDFQCIIKTNIDKNLQILIEKELESAKLGSGFEFNYNYFKKNNNISQLISEKLLVEQKLITVIKNSSQNKELLSLLKENSSDKNYFNLNNYQKYSKIYLSMIEDKEKFELDAIKIWCGQKINNINILTFTNKVSIDSSGTLIFCLEPSLINYYLKFIN